MRTARFALMLGLAGWISTARANDELARLAPDTGPDNDYRGPHTDFSADDPVGRFMDLLAEGAFVQATSLRPEVCSAWTRGRSSSPLSGRFSVNGVELSLDRLCGLEPLGSR